MNELMRFNEAFNTMSKNEMLFEAEHDINFEWGDYFKEERRCACREFVESYKKEFRYAS
jgi:hypothetical protein